MSQHPHDEFDDVPPYQTGEAGKHRSPGAAGTGAAGGSGFRWIALLAGFVLLVGAFAYFIVPMLTNADSESETGEPEETVTESGEASAEEGAEGEDAEGSADGEGAAEGGEAEGPQPATDTETPVQVANYQGISGGATAMGAELEGLDYNVVWEGNWNFEERADTPAVVYPAGAGEAEIAQAESLAENFDTAAPEEHPDVSYVTLIIGSEYEG
ncbi:LytR C-terminal domain-containing protein [Nesterenkonia sp. Act20]|uniref:LytR C-terminal domain-containing protein n=1 Tax=Nesterenkonia sp. Act20 TaxID=1483432 RepID=UPI001C447D22|nr:LytR C-terminal domain-containing protein [Nesterenkonia sp. Act20]